MGLFSWTCATCRLPIMNEYTPDELREATQVTYVDVGGSRVVGTYDGYGRIRTAGGGEFEIPFEAPTAWALYHTGCMPADLRAPGQSAHAHNQGHWAFSSAAEAKALLAKFAPHISWDHEGG